MILLTCIDLVARDVVPWLLVALAIAIAAVIPGDDWDDLA